jgi:anti-sigma B factor antagonist
MEINRTDLGNIIILEITGEINLFNAPLLKNCFDELISSKSVKIVVDLKKVDYLDSSGLGALIAGHKAFKTSGGKLKLCHLPGHVRKILNFTKMEFLFEIHDKCQSAVDSFNT